MAENIDMVNTATASWNTIVAINDRHVSAKKKNRLQLFELDNG